MMNFAVETALLGRDRSEHIGEISALVVDGQDKGYRTLGHLTKRPTREEVWRPRK